MVRLWRFIRALPIFFVLPTGLVVLNLGQILAFCLRPVSRRAFLVLNQGLSRAWADSAVLAARWTNGAHIVLTGDDVPSKENAIIFCNHQQMTDIAYLTHWGLPLRRNGDMKYFTKNPIRYVPGLGWALSMLSFPFVKRNWTRDRTSIARVFERITTGNLPVWLITFPEGTRITAAKHAAALDYADAHGLRRPVHTIVPRTKGFVAAVQGLRAHAAAVYDVTIAYPQGVATLWQYILGISTVAHLHVQRFAIESLPTEDEALKLWLTDRFEKKDRLLEAFHVDGEFPKS